MIARGFIAMHHVVSKSNVADIVTKHWGHSSVYHLLRPVFGHEGDTDELYEDDSPEALAAQYEESGWNVIRTYLFYVSIYIHHLNGIMYWLTY